MEIAIAASNSKGLRFKQRFGSLVVVCVTFSSGKNSENWVSIEAGLFYPNW